MSKGLKEGPTTLHLSPKKTEQECTFHCIFIKSGYSHFIFNHYYFSFVVQLLSHIRLFVTPWTAAHQASQCFTLSRSLLKLMSSESVMPSNHLVLCYPLLLLPSIFPRIRVFSLSQLFTSGDQSIRVSASTSVLPMSIQGCFL